MSTVDWLTDLPFNARPDNVAVVAFSVPPTYTSSAMPTPPLTITAPVVGEVLVNVLLNVAFANTILEDVEAVITLRAVTNSVNPASGLDISNITGSKPSGYGLVIDSSTYNEEPAANELKNIMLLVLVDCTCTRTLAATPLDGQLTTLKLVVPVDAIEYF